MIHQIISGNPLLWVDSFDYDRVIKNIANKISKLKNKRQIFKWDVTRGVTDHTGRISYSETIDPSPKAPLDFLYNYGSPAIMILMDYHKYIGEITVWRELLNSIEEFKCSGKTIIIVSPSIDSIPHEITRYITMVDFNFPSFEELLVKIKEIANELNIANQYSEDDFRELANSATGLTEFELENALTLSYSKFKKLTKSFISEQRKQMIKKTPSLEIYDNKQGFEAIVGMERLKEFSKKMIESGNGRGILLLGPAGTGKSLFAKCLGNETNRYTIKFDIGSLMGPYVGETERNTREALRIIDCQSQAVLFIDELEKAFSGVKSESNDSARRQGGKILEWMGDKTSDVFIVATANNIQDLPPEFLRAERWDAIFYIDLPNQIQSQQMLEYYCKEYSLEVTDVNIENWTGAEVKTLCRVASSLDISLEEAKVYVQPISKVAAEQIAFLKQWASTRSINASFEEA